MRKKVNVLLYHKKCENVKRYIKSGFQENEFVTAEDKNYLWHAKLSTICDKKIVIESVMLKCVNKKIKLQGFFAGWKLLQGMKKLHWYFLLKTLTSFGCFLYFIK